MELVIKLAQSPLFIHDDTVEYDASLFKVSPGLSVEDLINVTEPGVKDNLSADKSVHLKQEFRAKPGSKLVICLSEPD